MKVKMQVLCVILWGSLVLSFCAVAQTEAPKPKLSDEPLTAAQLAIYRVVLKDYVKDSKKVLNVANKTEPLDLSHMLVDKTCTEDLKVDEHEQSVPVIHQLRDAVTLNLRAILVDPDQQGETIKKGDPQNLIKGDIDGQKAVTEKQLDESLNEAVKNGLFSVSEIAFDAKHHHAVMTYSFWCGMLCGNGRTIVLSKVGGKWKIAKTCGQWMS